MKKIKILNIILLSAISIMFLYCSKKTETENTGNEVIEAKFGLTDTQFKNAQIELGKLTLRKISSVIKLNGKIDVPPQNMVSVSAPMGGYLKSTKLLPGMHIKKGEVIAILEDPQYIQLQQDYLLAKSKLYFAEMDYARQLELNKSQASSDKVMQMAHSEVNIQKITMTALAEKLKIINIIPNHLSVDKISKSIFVISSITGFVSKVKVNIGKYVNPSEVLFELIDPTDIHLNLKVYEKDIEKLSVGQKLKAYNNNNPDLKYNCEIILVAHDINSEGFAEVHCHFEGTHKTLAPGMYMNAEIPINSNERYAINEEAIVRFEGKNYLFTKTDKNEFVMNEAEIGLENDGFIQIKNSGEFIEKALVTKGAYTLLMALKNKKE